MYTNILCHIVGLNEIMKESLINEINGIDGAIIKDLDEITHKIRSDKPLSKLDNKISKLKRKIGKNKKNCSVETTNECKKCVTQYNKLWKDTVTKKLFNVCKQNKNKKIVLLGLSTHHKNSRLKINIDSKYKYLVTTKSHKSAKQVVEYNMDKYKKHIINGTFPLKYLDHSFINKQKKSTDKIYTNFGYATKSLLGTVNWIKLKLNHNPDAGDNISDKDNKTDDTNRTNNESLDTNLKGGYKKEHKTFYLGNKNKRTNNNSSIKKKTKWLQDSCIEKIMNNKRKQNSVVQEKYVAYDVEWLAILSALQNLNKYVKKGYFEYKNKKIPYVEERVENGFAKLNTDLYLYTAHDLQFSKIGYKYIGFGIDLYKHNNAIHIKNAHDRLKNIGVKFIKYNNNNNKDGKI